MAIQYSMESEKV